MNPPYFLKRLLLLFPTVLGLVTINFICAQFLPGGPVEAFLFQSGFAGDVEGIFGVSGLIYKDPGDFYPELQSHFGYDRPFWERYLKQVLSLMTFDFGSSHIHQREVLDLLWEKSSVSLTLGLSIFCVSYFICVPLGICKALNKDSFFDKASDFFLIVVQSVPPFVFGVLVLVFFGGATAYFPIKSLASYDLREFGILAILQNLFLPILCILMGNLFFMTHLTRNLLLEEFSKMYVKMARAKGLRESALIFKHLFKNIGIPLLAGFGEKLLHIFIASMIVIESLFSLDGLGLLTLDSIKYRDYPVVMALFYIFCLVHILGNLISDALYAFLDPRLFYLSAQNPSVGKNHFDVNHL